MKYHKNLKNPISIPIVLIFVLFIMVIGFFQRDVISRSLITVNLGSLYVKYLNEKAEFLNYIKKNNIETISFSLSPNNYVRLQKEDLKW